MSANQRSQVLSVLRACGALRLLMRLRRNHIAILTLHGVWDEEPSGWRPLRARISAQTLRAQLEILRRFYTFAPLSAAIEMLAGKVPIQPGRLVLTFDDGYRNNLTHALPVLRALNIPATIFVATGYVDQRRRFAFDRLDYALQRLPTGRHRFQIGNLTIEVDTDQRDELRQSFSTFRRALKQSIDDDARYRRELDRLTRECEQQAQASLCDLGDHEPLTAMLSWEEARTAAVNGLLDFGSHTVNHVRLALAPPDVVIDELRRSRERIEQQLGRPCRLLSYPNGSFDAGVVSLAAQAGYTSAVTTREGLNRIGDNLLTLRRIGLPLRADSDELLARVSGLSAGLSRLTRSGRSTRRSARLRPDEDYT